MIVQLRAVVCGLRSHTGLCEIVRPFPHQVDVFCQDQVSTNQRKSKKNLPPHVCRSFLSNIHNLKNQSETQLLRRHQESQPGNHALLKIHLASQCLYAYPTSEKKKTVGKPAAKYHRNTLPPPRIIKVWLGRPNHIRRIRVKSPCNKRITTLGIPVGDNLSISHRRSA